MKTIVVPTDLSPDTDRALSVAVTIARLHNATVVLLHSLMYPVPADPYPGGSVVIADYTKDVYHELEEEARQKLDRLVHTPAYAGVTIEPRLLKSGQGLLHEVTDTPADLIVMSSSGASGLQEWLIGSNAEVVVRHAHCPVLVIKEPVAHFQPENIVYAIDMDDRLKRTYHYPFPMGEKGVQTFLYVLTPTDNRQPDGLRDWANDFARAKGITNLTFEIRHARTIHEGVIQYAEDAHADLIVLFTHGHTGLHHLLTGSVAEDVLNHATTPVLIMRL